MIQKLQWTWAALMLATLVNFGTAELLGHALIAAALLMIVAGVKATMILRTFMELGDGPTSFKVFFSIWLVACVGMITVLYGWAP